MRSPGNLISPVALPFVIGWATATAATAAPFGVHVVDDATGRGVPLVQLRTTNDVRFFTDSGGLIAFDEPGLMDRDVWFTLTSPGYAAEAAPFGFPGVALRTRPGTVAELKVHRINIAERLVRLTGQGIYRDTVLLGRRPPIADPLLDAGVMGQDTVQSTVYRGQTYWFFGDTDRPGFPLGNFHTTGATSPPPGKFDPDVGVDLTYFADGHGFVRPMVDLKAATPIWIDGLMVVDHDGGPRLLARYAVVDAAMRPTDVGLLQWDDARRQFEPLIKLPTLSKLIPQGHAARVRDGGRDWFYFPAPLLCVRVPADWSSVTDPAAYEGFDGHAWHRGMPPTAKPDLHDPAGHRVRVHAATVNWNAYRRRWIALIEQAGGASNIGEVWYAEADHPEGPFGPAVKVATHAGKADNHDFYNPMQHPDWDRDGGRVIYFEGTYADTFSGNPDPTPRYNYNQLLYRLDLSDPRLEPARKPGVAVAPTPAGSSSPSPSARSTATPPPPRPSAPPSRPSTPP